MTYVRAFLPLLLLGALAPLCRAAELNLAGPWSVLLDRQNRGEANGWHMPAFWDSGKETASVQLPGSIQAQKVGDLPSVDSAWTARIGANQLNHPKYAPYRKTGEFKTPFWLTPERVYVGSAWFQRAVEIPPAFNNQRITLTLERPHWETTVWVDGKQVGAPQNSLGTPHVYDLTEALGPTPVGRHTLVIRVDNRIKIPVGLDASAVTDQTQSNWNGIVGDIKLVATPTTWIEDVQAFPDVANKKVKVRITARSAGGMPQLGGVAVSGNSRNVSTSHALQRSEQAVQWKAERNEAVGEVTLDLGTGAQTWSEHAPALYDLTVAIRDRGGKEVDDRIVTFGLREITTRGTQFLLNGKPLYLRGTLECAIFPLTGYPPTGEAGRPYWTKIYSQMKAFGLNHLRFHSWCPPEIAFTVADEMGIYLQIEGGVWAAFGSSGRPPTEPEADDAGGRGGASLDAWIVKEADAMLRAYGNHPSFLFMAAANEPGSRTNQPNATFLNALVEQWKAKDPRHLYTAGSNWPNVSNAQFQVMSAPRLNAGNAVNRTPNTELNYARVVSQWQVPVVSHESGQWCVYPNFAEISKYTGALKPGNLEIFQDFLGRSGMGSQAKEFLMASGRFQVILYKEEIEALLRTPGLGGFQLLDLHDFPGQGTAPVGVLDAFWDAKPYVTAEEYRRFCGPTVPLAVMPRRIYTAGETLTAEVLVSHFGEGDLLPCEAAGGTRTTWRVLEANGQAVLDGAMATPAIPAGGLTTVGRVSVPLTGFQAPGRHTLEVSVRRALPGAAATQPEEAPREEVFVNSWEFWVYPPARSVRVEPGENVRIARAFDDETRTFLEEGGRVLLLPPLESVAGDARSSFPPIFWNRITFTNPTKEHTLSILCDPKHKAFATFPTDAHTNWQWSDLLQPTRSKPMILSRLPQNVKPVIQFIDDWDTARRLALAVEGTYGERGGKILICSIDLHPDLATAPATAQGDGAAPRPVARQLLSSLLEYVSGPEFLAEREAFLNAEGAMVTPEPVPALTAEEIRTLLK